MTDQTAPTRIERKPEPYDVRTPLIVFDGVCVLCSGAVRTIVRLDRRGEFRFATAQSALGEKLYRQHGLRTDEYDTILVLIDGHAYVRLESFIAIMDRLGWPWRIARLLELMPRRARDRLYGVIARNRYAWFGRKDTCDIPSAELRARIID